jgi:transcription elongation factor GreA
VKDLDPAIKMGLRKKITEKFNDFKFFGEEEKATVSRGLIVTAEKYEEKQKYLQHILDVEVPTNSKEIAYALSLGDLRENAEYKAAKEKQDILNSTVAKLKNEIERAQLFDKSSLSTGRVSFGTRVTLINQSTGNKEEYVIMGPWESDPDRNIISYLSPFGSKLVNRRVGESFEFIINERKYNYTVSGISAGYA